MPDGRTPWEAWCRIPAGGSSPPCSLAQPIFNRGKLISNLRVSKNDEEIAKLNYKQALLEAGQEVNDALYATQSIQRTLDSHQRQCEELERTVHTSNALYRTGNATYLELLTARQSLLSARLNLVSDQFSRLQYVLQRPRRRMRIKLPMRDPRTKTTVSRIGVRDDVFFCRA